jgi:hypothetical protein
LKPAHQWSITVTIDASRERVWSAGDDLTLIPRYHPEVARVELLSGQSTRGVGVEYKCIIETGRRGWCVERVVEHVPLEKMTVDFPSDSWGISDLLDGFRTELLLEACDGGACRVTIRAFYEPKPLWLRLINPVGLRWLMRRRALQVLRGLKRFVEAGGAAA